MSNNEHSVMMEDLLKMMIQSSVTLKVEQIKEHGGPSQEDMTKAQESSDMLGEYGDILLHGGGKEGQRADLFNRTAHIIAVLSFAPGGIDTFGFHFEANTEK